MLRIDASGRSTWAGFSNQSRLLSGSASRLSASLNGGTAGAVPSSSGLGGMLGTAKKTSPNGSRARRAHRARGGRDVPWSRVRLRPAQSVRRWEESCRPGGLPRNAILALRALARGGRAHAAVLLARLARGFLDVGRLMHPRRPRPRPRLARPARQTPRLPRPGPSAQPAVPQAP